MVHNSEVGQQSFWNQEKKMNGSVEHGLFLWHFPTTIFMWNSRTYASSHDTTHTFIDSYVTLTIDVTCENVICSRIYHSFLGKKGKYLNLCDDKPLSSEFFKPQCKHEYGKGQFYYWRLIWISLTDVGNVFPMRLLIDFYTPKHINLSAACKSTFFDPVKTVLKKRKFLAKRRGPLHALKRLAPNHRQNWRNNKKLPKSSSSTIDISEKSYKY